MKSFLRRKGDASERIPPAEPPRHGLGDFVTNQPAISEVLARALGLAGGELPHILDPLFGLSLNVEDFTRPEYDWCRRTLRYTVGASQAAVAAQFSFFEFFVSATLTRKLAIIEHLWVASSAATQVQIGLSGAVAVGAQLQPSPTDDRFGGAPGAGIGSSVICNFGTSAAPVRPAGSVMVVQTTTAPIDLAPWIISGIANLVIIGVVANVGLTVSATWRERVPLQTEL